MRPLPTLRQLRYLTALAEYRHFGRAAEACLATQSTLSAGLQELESLLGVTLVERTKRKVMLTPLGEEVVARARVVLQGAEDIAELAHASRAPLSGTVRLGVIPTVAPFLLPQVLPALRDTYPELRLLLREDQTARVLARLAAGDLDVVLMALPWPADDVETLALFDDPFVVACPPNHPLAGRETVAAADLATVPLLLLEEGHCLREHALAACRLPTAGRTAGLGDGLLATSLATLVHMVANGLGITLLPEMAVAAGILAGTSLVTRPLAEPAHRTIGLVWRRSSPRKQEFALLGKALAGRRG